MVRRGKNIKGLELVLKKHNPCFSLSIELGLGDFFSSYVFLFPKNPVIPWQKMWKI
jgi:hypothetical protein